MATITYPSGGRLMTGPLTESPAKHILRTEFESGDIKQTRLSQKQRMVQKMTFVYTNDEYTTFKAWHRDTALMGALKFDFADPQNDTVRDYRIIEGRYEAAPLNQKLEHWSVVMSWEYFI